MKPWDKVATSDDATLFPPTAAFPRTAAFPPMFSAVLLPTLGSPAAPIIAHQGGWDEILLVAAPLALMGSLLVIANRRVKAKLDAQRSDADA